MYARIDANRSNRSRRGVQPVPFTATLLALLGGLLMAVGPTGCGTDDFNTVQEHGDDGASSGAQTANTTSPVASDGGAVATQSQQAGVMEPEPGPGGVLGSDSGPGDVTEPEPDPSDVSRDVRSQDVLSYEEAEALYHRGEYDQAIRGFAAYAEQHPGSAWGQYMLGLAHWKRGEYVAGAEALREAARQRPDLTKAHLNLARVCLDARRPQEAHDAARRAVVLEPSNADAQRVLARALHNLGLADRALEVYQRVLSLRPDDAWAMNNMGLILIEEERFLEAVGPLAKATASSPEQAVFHNNLGVALERLGHPDEAAEAYRQTLAIDSTYVRAAVSLDRVLPLAAASDAPAFDLARHMERFEQKVAGWQAEAMPAARDEEVPVAPAEPTTAAVER